MQNFIANNGVLAVFLLMTAESACIPIPSELIMLLGGALAAGTVHGSHPNLVLIIVAGVVGNVVGSYLAFAVGRYGGQALLNRWSHSRWLREDDIERATRWFDRQGPKAVGIGRVVPVVRTFISLPAGIAAMNPVKFGIYTVIGCIPWTTGLAIAGYELGANWQSVANDFHGPTYAIAGVVVVAIVIAAAIWLRRRKAEIRTAAATEPRQPTAGHRR